MRGLVKESLSRSLALPFSLSLSLSLSHSLTLALFLSLNDSLVKELPACRRWFIGDFAHTKASVILLCHTTYYFM